MLTYLARLEMAGAFVTHLSWDTIDADMVVCVYALLCRVYAEACGGIPGRFSSDAVDMKPGKMQTRMQLGAHGQQPGQESGSINN